MAPPLPTRLRPDSAAQLVQRVRELASADPATRDLCRTLVSALEREDRQRGSDLQATLQAYYACGLRVDRTADALFLHRNSVRYRLDRIRLLCGVNIDAPEIIAALTIALLLPPAKAMEDIRAG
jgi:DNA-binding PucR family transcriptional regulator